MKRNWKVLLVNILFVVLSSNVYAQQQEGRFNQSEEQGETEARLEDEDNWVLRIDGDVLVSEEDSTWILQEEMRFEDGSTIRPDGTVVRPDGKTVIMLEDGQAIFEDGEVAQADVSALIQERYNLMSRDFGMMEEIQMDTYEKVSFVNRKLELTNRKADLMDEKLTHTSRIVFCPDKVSRRDKAEASHRIDEINQELEEIDSEIERINEMMEDRELTREHQDLEEDS